MKRYLLTGLAAILPITITIWIISKIISVVNKSIGQYIVKLFYFTGINIPYKEVAALIISLIFIFFLLLIIGFFLTSWIGRTIYNFIENTINKIPILRSIYPSVKRIVEFIFQENSPGFEKVVMIEYPRRGIFSLGFVTSQAIPQVCSRTGKKMVNVFVSTSPTPMTGFVVTVPEEELIHVPISVEDAFKFIVSAGVVVPEKVGIIDVRHNGIPIETSSLKKNEPS